MKNWGHLWDLTVMHKVYRILSSVVDRRVHSMHRLLPVIVMDNRKFRRGLAYLELLCGLEPVSGGSVRQSVRVGSGGRGEKRFAGGCMRGPEGLFLVCLSYLMLSCIPGNGQKLVIVWNHLKHLFP